jgi:hypothetical protein
MKLLEIVRGRETSKEVVATSLKLAKKLGKVGVVVGNCFGFVANRMLAYYMREAYLLLEEGASVPDIDQALTDFGMPVGPFGMQDIAGIDVGARIRQYLKSIGMTRAEGPQSEIPDQLYEMGRYGQKTGAGWYRYESGSRTPVSIRWSSNWPTRLRRTAADAPRHRRRRSWSASLRRLPTKARACSTRAMRRARATSTSSTAMGSASRAIGAARCSTQTPLDSRPCWSASTSTASDSATTGNPHRSSSGWPPRDEGLRPAEAGRQAYVRLKPDATYGPRWSRRVRLQPDVLR